MDRREPSRPDVARASAARVGGVARRRRVARRGVGRAPRVERQPRGRGRAPAGRSSLPAARRAAPSRRDLPRARGALRDAVGDRHLRRRRPHAGLVGVPPPRSLAAAPSGRRSPRPVLLNTWEAVYFDHDTGRLRSSPSGRRARRRALRARRRVVRFAARRPVAVSATGGCRPTSTPTVWPRSSSTCAGSAWSSASGSSPRWSIPTATSIRAHPDWALDTPGYEPVLGRHQLVLDLARPEAFADVLGQLDALLTDHDIAFVKWDMNRDHVQGSGADGAAGTHAQTMALYRLLDELRERDIRRSRSRAARRAAPASTSASSPAPIGCGRATATTRSNARRSSAALRCSSRPR